MIIIIVGITVLSLSIVYLDYTKIDYQHELDAYHIALEVHKKTSVINKYPPEDRYVHNKDQVFWNMGNFPVLQSETELKVKAIRTYDIDSCRKEMPSTYNLALCRQYDFASLNEFIDFSKNQGLTHIIADGNSNRPDFIKDVFENEGIPYLTKIYDSSEYDYDYHLKIFRIDYEKFELIGHN